MSSEVASFGETREKLAMFIFVRLSGLRLRNKVEYFFLNFESSIAKLRDQK